MNKKQLKLLNSLESETYKIPSLEISEKYCKKAWDVIFKTEKIQVPGIPIRNEEWDIIYYDIYPIGLEELIVLQTNYRHAIQTLYCHCLDHKDKKFIELIKTTHLSAYIRAWGLYWIWCAGMEYSPLQKLISKKSKFIDECLQQAQKCLKGEINESFRSM